MYLVAIVGVSEQGEFIIGEEEGLPNLSYKCC